MKRYKFECVDFDSETNEETRTVVEFTTNTDTWSGFSGPMWKFYDFLHGCGFVFDKHAEIGVLEKTGNFRSAGD